MNVNDLGKMVLGADLLTDEKKAANDITETDLRFNFYGRDAVITGVYYDEDEDCIHIDTEAP